MTLNGDGHGNDDDDDGADDSDDVGDGAVGSGHVSGDCNQWHRQETLLHSHYSTHSTLVTHDDENEDEDFGGIFLTRVTMMLMVVMLMMMSFLSCTPTLLSNSGTNQTTVSVNTWSTAMMMNVDNPLISIVAMPSPLVPFLIPFAL